MKIIHYHLNRAPAEYRRKLREGGIDTLDVWQARWIILKNIEDWIFKEHIMIENLLSCYKGTIIEDILILKQKIKDIFLESKSQREAQERRDELLEEDWHLKTKHFADIVKFLSSPYFKYMTTYLDYPQIPKSGFVTCFHPWGGNRYRRFMKRQKDSFRYCPSNTMPWQMGYLEFYLIQDGDGPGERRKGKITKNSSSSSPY